MLNCYCCMQAFIAPNKSLLNINLLPMDENETIHAKQKIFACRMCQKYQETQSFIRNDSKMNENTRRINKKKD